MVRLARSFRVLPLAQALDAIEDGKIADNAVVLTFDDGYRDNYDHAFPVLRRLGLPATVFLTTGLVGTRGMLWHDRVIRAFQRTTRLVLGPIGDPPVVHDLGTAELRRNARLRVIEELKSLHPVEREERIRDLLERLGDDDGPPPERLLLSWDEVVEMHRHGISFGSHTVTHAILSRISIDEARAELVESRREIERRLGAPCVALAYPNGRPADYTPEVQALARDAGYRCALTTVFGAHPARGATPAGSRFEIRRMGVREPDPDLFLAKMSLYKLTT
jgi:peptidoglycan/xylan/chitin deacetylase (PgdA/CDA1 family)